MCALLVGLPEVRVLAVEDIPGEPWWFMSSRPLIVRGVTAAVAVPG
jgi:hypothetical protein